MLSVYYEKLATARARKAAEKNVAVKAAIAEVHKNEHIVKAGKKRVIDL